MTKPITQAMEQNRTTEIRELLVIEVEKELTKGRAHKTIPLSKIRDVIREVCQEHKYNNPEHIEMIYLGLSAKPAIVMPVKKHRGRPIQTHGRWISTPIGEPIDMGTGDIKKFKKIQYSIRSAENYHSNKIRMNVYFENDHIFVKRIK
jgi:hypothetical protein